MVENIFGDDPLEVVVRFDKKAKNIINKQNGISFSQIKSALEESMPYCFFTRKNDDTHTITIPSEELNKNIIIDVRWEITFDYKAVIHPKKGISFSGFTQDLEDEYTIKEECVFKIIDAEASNRSKEDLEVFYNKVNQLRIAPRINTDQQKQIWSSWIKAQELIINRHSSPIKITRIPTPIPITDNKGTIFRYETRIRIPRTKSSGFGILEERMAEEPFNIEQPSFSPDGSIQLAYDNIVRGVDAIIKNELSDRFERESNIACILKINTPRLCDRISAKLDNKFKVFQRTEKKQILVKSNISDFLLLEKMKGMGFIQIGYNARFEILNHGDDLTKHEETIKKYRLGFGKGASASRGFVFPEPNKGNIFSYWEKEKWEIVCHYKSLCCIYGKENIIQGDFIVFKSFSNLNEEDFNSAGEDYWQDLKKDFYNLPFDVGVRESDSIISFDFRDKKDLEDKFRQLKQLGKIEERLSPLHEEFKFKIRLRLIVQKTERELFDEKLKYLHGVPFQKMVEKSKKRIYYTIGNLNYYKSSFDELVLQLPYKYKDEKKEAKKTLAYLEDSPEISHLTPNLIGDKFKISWLREAMDKVTSPKESLDKKAINDRLPEFIFDASKAEEVFADLDVESEESRTLEKHELLTLNASQRKAVLTALHAEDLALLQGPPGTGKTTVIAEMIWQLVRQKQNQRILLTSETNLAVDNALDRLLNPQHTLVKPIRFGRSSKFEEEGKRYSVERITKWLGSKEDDLEVYDEPSLGEETEEEDIAKEDFSNNAIQIWMNRIAGNADRRNEKYADIIKDWTMDLAQPTTEMKSVFKNTYFKYANVIGSTSSSAGSSNFGADYHRIFSMNENVEDVGKQYKYLKRQLGKDANFKNTRTGRGILTYISPIEFDTIITDEASKATPPELLLPMCFGKKNVIIGDHKQLPPMLHDRDFVETLQSLDTPESADLAKEIDKDFVGISQFERLIETAKEKNPSIFTSFNEQYRMHPKINNVIKQFYLDDEGLEPAALIMKYADDKDLDNRFSRHHGLYFPGFISPDIHTIWVDVKAPEEKSGTSRINTTEIKAIEYVLKILKNAEGFDAYMNHWNKLRNKDKQEEKEVGLITFYGHQVSKMKDVAQYSKSTLDIPTRLKTVDKFQGMERNIIICSTVRSNKIKDGMQIKENRDIGFAKSPKRLNVALSRARRLLIVVGNKDFFSNYKNKKGEYIYKNVINIIQKEGKIIPYDNLEKIAKEL